MPRVIISETFDYRIPGTRSFKAFKPSGNPISVNAEELAAIIAANAGTEAPVEGAALPPPSRVRGRRNAEVVTAAPQPESQTE